MAKLKYCYFQPGLRTGFFIRWEGRTIRLWDERQMVFSFGSFPPPDHRISYKDVCMKLREHEEPEVAEYIEKESVKTGRFWFPVMAELGV